MPSPVLYVFSISHFCEKAKWALDYLGIDYHLKVLLPGPHAALAKQLGVRCSSLPILVADDEIIQGSSPIIDWAEKHAKAEKPSLMPDSASVKTDEIERRLDEITGVHVRRMFYSEAMVEYPASVKPVFSEGLSMLEKIKLSLMWPMVRKKMIALMDLGTEQRLESKNLIETELDWLDGLLSDGRQYLVGDKFSRVDLTAASLLGRMANPPEHPAQEHFTLPPQAQQDAAGWRKRPILKWVGRMYAQHRV